MTGKIAKCKRNRLTGIFLKNIVNFFFRIFSRCLIPQRGNSGTAITIAKCRMENIDSRVCNSHQYTTTGQINSQPFSQERNTGNPYTVHLRRRKTHLPVSHVQSFGNFNINNTGNLRQLTQKIFRYSHKHIISGKGIGIHLRMKPEKILRINRITHNQLPGILLRGKTCIQNVRTHPFFLRHIQTDI